MKELYQRLKDWLRGFSERRAFEECAARQRQAEKYCYIGDVESMPYIFVADVPIYYISSHATDGRQLVVNIDDAAGIVRAIRGKYIRADED